ncbi:hypothetical protein N8390_04245 [Amylibacter sp.]|nr:hypothetical protein [Amylibacter sp.]
MSMQLNKLTGLVLLCLAFFTSGLVAQENKFSLSSYGDELSSEPNKFFYFDELDGVLFLDGNIKEGMYTNFRQAIAENKIHTIVLNSMGGNVQEGLNIAGTVFDKGIKTYIPSGNECYSACSFIFFAGSEKYALGKLGVHQAAYADEISKEKIAVGVIKTISQISTADILLRLGEFNTPRFVEQRMLRTAPEDMYIFNKKELNKLGNLEISDNNKIFYEKIDNFINALQLHYAELDCENDATKCSPSQLCSRAAANKSWNTTTISTKYVTEAKRKGLSCGVPVPVCPEDIKKCNQEYLCTYGTTGMDASLSWLNNSFANEAKLRGYSCGIKLKPNVKTKYEEIIDGKVTCVNQIKDCSDKRLCSRATKTINSNILWVTNKYLEKYITEAKRRGLSCGVKDSRRDDVSLIMFIQTYLNKLGCNAGTVDGELGPKTLSALERWKNSGGNYTKGVIDQKLRISLYDSPYKCHSEKKTNTPKKTYENLSGTWDIVYSLCTDQRYKAVLKLTRNTIAKKNAYYATYKAPHGYYTGKAKEQNGSFEINLGRGLVARGFINKNYNRAQGKDQNGCLFEGNRR